MLRTFTVTRGPLGWWVAAFCTLLLIAPDIADAAAVQSGGKPARKAGSASTKSRASAKPSLTKKTPAKRRTAASRRGKRAAQPVRKQLRPTPQRYREIQAALAKGGYYQGPANGVWGQSSIDALSRFQREKGLEPTGRIDALTLIRLDLGPKYDAHAAPATANNDAPQ